MNAKLNRLDPTSLATNPRASLASWKRYEPIVESAIARHPQPFVYKCQTLKPSTVCTRLRDAVRGKLTFDYESTLTTETVARWYGEVVFKHDLENLYIGAATKVQGILDGSGVSGGDAPLTFTTLDFEEIVAFGILLSNNRLVGPITVKIPPDLSLLPQRDNLEIVKNTDGSIMLL